MYNLNNHAQFIGTLDADPENVPQQGGGSVTSIVLACRDNFLKRDGSPSVQHIPMAAVIPDGAEDPLSGFSKGDMINAGAQLVNKHWTDADGNGHTELQILVTHVQPMDA